MPGLAEPSAGMVALVTQALRLVGALGAGDGITHGAISVNQP